MRGWSVLTRPSSISGDPVTAATSVTGSPASRRARAVPPVETSSKPRATSPRPSVDQPRLVRDRQQRAPRGRDRGVGPAEILRDPTAVRLDREGAGEEPGDDLRQKPVLHGPDPVVERRGVVAGQDRHGLLGDDRAAVEGRVDQVDGAAGDPHARGESVLDRVRARERRQEGRVRVDDPAVERGQDGRPDDPHVAGEDDRVDPHRGEGRRERLVVAAGDERGLDPLLRRPRQRRAVSIGEDEADLATQLAPARRSRERPQVGARTRDADRHAAGAVHAWLSRGPST